MNQTAYPTPGQDNQAEIARYQLERQLKSSASWFYWIAGLSAVNWIASVFNIGYSFVVGLGVTQVIDAIARYMIEDLGPESSTILTVINFVAMIGLAGMYVLFGFFGNRRATWAFVVGSLLYVLDAGLFLWAKDYLPLIFHALALFSLVRGPGIIKRLNRLDEMQSPPGAIQPLQ